MIKEYGYEYDTAVNNEFFNNYAGKCAEKTDGEPFLLRSGRDALKVIAREYDSCTAFLPSLSCDSMVLPFEMCNHTVSFYKLSENYSIDYDHLNSLAEKENSRILFLYMNYFGNKAVADNQLQELKDNYRNIIFIEDRTHDLIYPHQNKFKPDYTVASLRKWLNIADGGLLWGEKAVTDTDFSSCTSFSEERRNAQCMRHLYLQNGDENLKTEFRRIFSTVTDQIDNSPSPGKMSLYSYNMAKNADWGSIKGSRTENAGVLLSILSNNSKIKLIQDDIQKSNLYFPVLIDNRDSVQRLLASKGIFTTLIWPLSDKQKKSCETADFTENHMLGIPCDQRYTPKDMKFIGEEFLKAIND